jgi:type I restriction enzyme S subunit
VGSIGKIGIAPASWAGANIARAVCRIAPDEGLVDARFLAETLCGQQCQTFFREQTRTLAQPTLNVGHLEGTPVRLPALAEQRRIIAELDALQAKVDAVKRLQTETAAELDALLPSILDRAFKGEL